jgi:microcystin-dependent protein
MGIDRYVGEIQVWPGGAIPRGWALCDGRLLPVAQNAALFSLLGTCFGGNGATTFALPDLRGRTPVGNVQGKFAVGQSGGSEAVALDATNLPAHSHRLRASNQPATSATVTKGMPATVPANGPPIYSRGAPNVAIDPDSISSTGNGQPHDNMQPSLGLNFIICLAGPFPHHQ